MHAVSLSAAEGALCTVATTARAIGAEAMDGEANSATEAAVESTEGDFTHRRARAAMMASYDVAGFYWCTGMVQG